MKAVALTTYGDPAAGLEYRVTQSSAVIAGHQRPGNDDSPQTIEETRQYIRDFDRVALWLSARAVKP